MLQTPLSKCESLRPHHNAVRTGKMWSRKSRIAQWLYNKIKTFYLPGLKPSLAKDSFSSFSVQRILTKVQVIPSPVNFRALSLTQSSR